MNGGGDDDDDDEYDGIKLLCNYKSIGVIIKNRDHAEDVCGRGRLLQSQTFNS